MKTNTMNREIDIKLSAKVYKKAVKNYVADLDVAGVFTKLRDILETANHDAKQLENTFRDALAASGVKHDISHTELMAMAEPNKTGKSVAEYSAAWANYNVGQKLSKVLFKQYAINHLLDDEYTKKIKGVFTALLDRQVKSKEGKVIMNALVNPIARALEHKDSYIARNYAANILSVLQNYTELLELSRTKVVKDGVTKYEWMVHLNLEMKDLEVVYDTIQNRKVTLANPESVEGKDIYTKKKFAYTGKVPAQSAVAIDHLNSMRYSVTCGRDDIELLVKRKIFGNAIDKQITERWQKRILDNALYQYDLIMETGNNFSIEHEADGVGRLYETSEYYGLMQNSIMRECIAQAEEEELTEEGRYAIQLAIAAKMGYDKKTEEEMYDAFLKNNWAWRKEAKLAEYYHALDTGKTNLLIELDAQTQGTQIYGLMSGHKGTCFISGLYGDMRTDGYQMLADKLNAKLDTDKFNRANVKSAFMVVQYSAKYKTIMFGSKYDEDSGLMKGGSKKQVPLMAISPRSAEATWAAFQEAMYEISPKAMKLMQIIEEVAKKDNRTLIKFNMPDLFECQVAMTKVEEEHIQWIDKNGAEHQMKHHVTELVAGSKPTAWAPRIVQAVDAYILREVQRRAKAEGYHIGNVHDAYLQHPNYVFKTNRIYREVCADVFKMDILSDIMNQLTGQKYNFQAQADITYDEILDAKYALWF